MNTLNTLPAPIATHILSYLDDPKDLLRMRKVSKRFNNLVSDAALWSRFRDTNFRLNMKAGRCAESIHSCGESTVAKILKIKSWHIFYAKADGDVCVLFPPTKMNLVLFNLPKVEWLKVKGDTILACSSDGVFRVYRNLNEPVFESSVLKIQGKLAILLDQHVLYCTNEGVFTCHVDTQWVDKIGDLEKPTRLKYVEPYIIAENNRKMVLVSRDLSVRNEWNWKRFYNVPTIEGKPYIAVNEGLDHSVISLETRGMSHLFRLTLKEWETAGKSRVIKSSTTDRCYQIASYIRQTGQHSAGRRSGKVVKEYSSLRHLFVIESKSRSLQELVFVERVFKSGFTDVQKIDQFGLYFIFHGVKDQKDSIWRLSEGHLWHEVDVNAPASGTSLYSQGLYADISGDRRSIKVSDYTGFVSLSPPASSCAIM